MAFLGQEEQLREYQDKFRYLQIALFVFLGLIVSRLIYLQVFNGDRMLRFSEENRIKEVAIPATRGMIFDRNRVLLIDNQPSFDLELTPQYLKGADAEQKQKTIQKLSTLVDLSPEEIQRRLQSKSTQAPFIPVKVKTELNRDEVAKVETWKIDMPGVAVAMEIQRTNVYQKIASHLLGYIGKVNKREIPELREQFNRSYDEADSVGKFGIELQLENLLQGRHGQRLVEVDVLGREIRRQSGRGQVLTDNNRDRPAIPGKNLVLTIDQDLQLVATQAFGEKVGGLVALDPRNGEILAMISRPSFDPTEFSRGISAAVWSDLLNDEDRPLRDKTLQDHYSPGSVFKAISAITGLEEGVIDGKKAFHCPGKIKVGPRFYHCHKEHGHGWVSVREAIEVSCDVFFYRVAQKLKSVDDFAKWARRFGLGQRTGIELPREVPGLIPTEAWKQERFGTPWTAGESLSVAIGQSFVLTTVLQLANLYAAIANGGKLYHPHYLRKIETFDGQEVKNIEPKLLNEVQMSPENISLVKRGLWRVINSPKGTGYRLKLPGMDFAGKSGTVQVVRSRPEDLYKKCASLPYRRRHHGVFAGYAPADDPVIAVAVLAEHECSGSAGAGPIVRDVIKAYLQKFDPKKYSDEALAEYAKKEGSIINQKLKEDQSTSQVRSPEPGGGPQSTTEDDLPAPSQSRDEEDGPAIITEEPSE